MGCFSTQRRLAAHPQPLNTNTFARQSITAHQAQKPLRKAGFLMACWQFAENACMQESLVHTGDEQSSYSGIQTVMAPNITAKLLIATALTATPITYEAIQPRPTFAQEYCNVFWIPTAYGNFSPHPSKGVIKLSRGGYSYLKKLVRQTNGTGHVTFGPMNCTKAEQFRTFVNNYGSTYARPWPYLRHKEIKEWFGRWR